MNGKQKKLIENWVVLGTFLVIVIAFQDVVWQVSWAVLPMSIYIVFNWAHIHEFQRRSRKPGQIIERSRKIKYWVYLSSAILISGALVLLSNGLNIFDYFGFGSLLLIVFLPLLPVIFASQIALYYDLANEP